MNCVFTANTPNNKITLLKIKETKNSQNNNFSDLLLIFPGSSKYSFNTDLKKLMSDSELIYEDSANQHTSIHYNPVDDNIVIKKTYKDKSQQTEDIFQLYKNPGMKRDKLFIPIVFRSYGNTLADKFEYTKKRDYTEVPLDFSYNPEQDTLQIMIITSLIEKDYFSNIEFPANSFSYDFKNFKVTLIYKFFNKPSLPQSINFTPILSTGLDWWEINNLVTSATLLYSEHYFKINK